MASRVFCTSAFSPSLAGLMTSLFLYLRTFLAEEVKPRFDVGDSRLLL